MSCENISSDEMRLVMLFRSLETELERSELLTNLTDKLLRSLHPESTVYDFMPSAAGIEPNGSIYDASSIAHVLYCGIQATGDPLLCLMGSSYWDEKVVIPLFAEGADSMATNQGSFFDYREEFARKYIPAWRWYIVNSIVSARLEVNRES